MDRIYVSQFSVRKLGSEHVMRVGWWSEHDIEDRIAEARTDLNLGNILAAFSSVLRTITGGASCAVASYGGPIELESWTVEPLTLWPFRWHMTMVSPKGIFEPRMDGDLEGLIQHFSAATRFFCFKHGLTTLDPDVVRNRDRAGELGLLTQEDFHA